MSNDTNDDPFERWWAATPENKLELIDGQLIISTLAGSRRIAWTLLDDYGPPTALSLAPSDLWWEALRQAFDPQPSPRTPEEWTRWAATFEHDPEPPPAGPLGSREHHRAYELLWQGLYRFTGRSGLGRSLGRDFVIRLGENGLTPDQLFVDWACLPNLHEYYLDGPPPIVIEVTLEGSAEEDRVRKRSLYESAGVSEYWLIESAAQEAIFFRLGADGRYHRAAPDDRLVYHSAAVPGLALSLPHLWTMDRSYRDEDCLPFLTPTHRDDRPLHELESDRTELGWDSLPFVPRIGLKPVPIQFAEFISWCPRAKFEVYGGLVIDGREGTRRCLGMLLMTLGLVEAVKLASPRDWVTFLYPEPYEALVRQRTDDLMAHAEYSSERFGDEEYVSGKIPQLPEVLEVGDDLAECRKSLMVAVRNRVLLRIARGQDPTCGRS